MRPRQENRIVIIQPTFHTQRYSSSFGGSVFLVSDGCSSTPSILSSVFGTSFPASLFWLSDSSKASNSRSFATSPKFFTAGRPFRNDLSFRVNRGPISCKATFSVDRKAYLQVRFHVNQIFCPLLKSSTNDIPVPPEEQKVTLVM